MHLPVEADWKAVPLSRAGGSPFYFSLASPGHRVPMMQHFGIACLHYCRTGAVIATLLQKFTRTQGLFVAEVIIVDLSVTVLPEGSRLTSKPHHTPSHPTPSHPTLPHQRVLLPDYQDPQTTVCPAFAKFSLTSFPVCQMTELQQGSL